MCVIEASRLTARGGGGAVRGDIIGIPFMV
jgi:hypothetical protein